MLFISGRRFFSKSGIKPGGCGNFVGAGVIGNFTT